MTFIKFLLLLLSIYQNQKTIALNTEELGLTRATLKEDTLINQLKFHLELIDMNSQAINTMINENPFNSPRNREIHINGKHAPLGHYIRDASRKRQTAQYWQTIYEDSLTRNNALFQNLNGLFKTLINSIYFINIHNPGMRNYYRNHQAIANLHLLTYIIFNSGNHDQPSKLSWITEMYEDFISDSLDIKTTDKAA
jgi:hypothetical protein